MSASDTEPTVRVVAISADGTQTEVTEGVQALYDHTVSSMDWGSGFLTIEDAVGIIKVAQACGFLMPESAAAAFEQYAEAAQHGGGNNIICAVCGEAVVHRYASTDAADGWRHRDSDPGHEPRLWR